MPTCMAVMERMTASMTSYWSYNNMHSVTPQLTHTLLHAILKTRILILAVLTDLFKSTK